MATAAEVTGIVLAGGQSSRMGQDKALIPVQGVPLLQHICEVAQACCSDVYVVTSRLAQYQSILPPGCQGLLEQPLGNETFPSGPLVGFAQGLAEVTTPWVLLLACDLPYLQVAVLQEWVTQLPSDPERAIAHLPRHPKGWEPLCGFYHRRCLGSLETFITAGGRSFQNWLADQVVKPLPLTDQQMLFNCNTPADLAVLSPFSGLTAILNHPSKATKLNMQGHHERAE